jgi:tetratricopeptide (TPR) repeat protein
LDALERDPGHVPSLNNLADAYEISGQPEKAHELFHYIIKLEPNTPLPHFNLGNFFLRQNQHIEAAKCYEEVLRIDESFTDAYYNIAWILYKAKAFEKSLYYAEKGLVIEDDHNDLIQLAQSLKNELSR